MDFGNKLEELHMTTEEINRLSKAMKSAKFCELLHEYAQEISNPENKKKYEEEITQLEQEKGIEVKFIHPNAHHVLKTSVNGKEKCFINICSNDLIKEPTCEARRAENGQIGHCWSLPYSLTPGRPEIDSKGNKYMIYDVVFHPHTLYMADKNKIFMKFVNSTAIQGVENYFEVTLDKTNTVLKKTQYKGVPQPAVIRNQISGQPKEEESSLYDKDVHKLFSHTMPIKKPKSHSSSFTQSPTKQSSFVPIQPHYTIKYRSFVDLQDYRCSRDSAPGPHPKEIVITIDLPLLKSAADVDLNITDRTLTLESQMTNYKLDLQLSYPVDDKKGDAKFNKAKKQLTITLAVQPAKNHAMVHVKGNQPESDNSEVMGTAEKAYEAAYEAELVTEEQNELIISDAICEAYPQGNKPVQGKEEDAHFSIVEEKISVVESQMKHTALHLEETLHNVQNSPVNLSNWEKYEVESSVISNGPNQMNSPLDTIQSLSRHEVPGALSEDQNSSTKPSSFPVALDEQVDNADFSKQRKTDLILPTPTILREKNPTDGSEIITDHTTFAALCFQNSLWFELD